MNHYWTTGEIRRCFETPGDHDVWETLPVQRSDNEVNNEVYLVETARSVAHHAEHVGRPEDGSSREKAEAPAEVAAGAGQEWLRPISGGGR